MTITSPSKQGTDPITSAAATIRPHAAIGSGFVTTAWIEVQIAVSIFTSRSSNSGKDTTLIVRVRTANRNPIPTPRMIIAQPASVVNTSWTNAAIETGGFSPR